MQNGIDVSKETWAWQPDFRTHLSQRDQLAEHRSPCRPQRWGHG